MTERINIGNAVRILGEGGFVVSKVVLITNSPNTLFKVKVAETESWFNSLEIVKVTPEMLKEQSDRNQAHLDKLAKQMTPHRYF